MTSSDAFSGPVHLTSFSIGGEVISTVRIAKTPGVKTVYLVERKPSTSRDDLVVFWLNCHMQNIIATKFSERGRMLSAYTVSLIDQETKAYHQSDGPNLDGIAALTADRRIVRKNEDEFHQRTLPFHGWYTTEYVVIDPAPRISMDPRTEAPPLPRIRTRVNKVSQLFKGSDGSDGDELERQWLEVRAPKVRQLLLDHGAFGFTISIALDSRYAGYVGLEEYYFEDEGSWHLVKDCNAMLATDIFEGSHAYITHTEFVGF